MSETQGTEPEEEAPLTGEEQERLVRERYEKAGRAAEAGVPLFVNRFIATHHAAQIAAWKGEVEAGGDKGEVTVAGRVVGVRSFGKAAFLKLRDKTGDVQVYIKHGVTEEAGFALYKQWLDTGDIVGVRGKLFITKTGELTIEGRTLELLTKSMRPLPGKWHGLKDVELRYRQRYVDLIVNPKVAETFRARSRAIAFIRRFLDEREYIEVETPMMQAIYGGAAARPFQTKHNALDMPLFLRIAPELYLKRLIVGGMERVYEINRNFRNEGVSTRHNPEFTMLELYTQGWDYNDTMDLTEELIRETAKAVRGTGAGKWGEHTIDLDEPFRRLRILDAIAEHVGLEGEHRLAWGIESREALREAFGAAAEHPAVAGTLIRAKTPDETLVTLFEENVESTLKQPTFVIDYPKSLCPLTKSKADDPLTAERFELYIGGIEIANAYSELNDPAEQLRRFEEQVAQKAAGDDEAMSEVDRDYVRALEYGMPPCSGLGIGIDRLVMMLTDSASIRDVILFPLMRAER